MLVERLYLTSPVDVDRNALALITTACGMLASKPVVLNELWPGKVYDLQT